MTTLQKLWQRGCDFLGTDAAILGGAMSWVSERTLVSAISNAGGFGVIACGAMPVDLLEQEIKATQSMTTKPFGVNLITMHPQLLELIDVCIRYEVTHIVLAGGLPPAEAISKVKSANIKLICFAPTLTLARKLIRLGVDALVIEGSEAGGHIGPVSTSVLAQEILPHITEVPVFVAGGIGRGETIANYLLMGASGAQLGTRFVCATECQAHADFKKAFIRASARDAVASVQLDHRLPVIPVRALQNAASARFIDFQRQMIKKLDQGEIDLKSAQLEVEHFWGGALRRAVVDGDIENGSVMAGQSVGMVKEEQPTAHIIEELIAQADAFLARN
ncbi:NAD(P)H-dependent flavin oxidoreductase [Candidatus Odyssella thessalonicensis]|uniref:NAD(P)H-dependent flavin oxidoreductase n=1 Tax=Candidatus Odyssella thessalonicensis TaxID=84647 RepID=UPI000225A976|nr:nitronate monooxygenase [Candidatus Odyssella thessalonicensis]